MAELADAHDSKSCGAIHVGSTPTLGTKAYEKYGFDRTFFIFYQMDKLRFIFLPYQTRSHLCYRRY